MKPGDVSSLSPEDDRRPKKGARSKDIHHGLITWYRPPLSRDGKEKTVGELTRKNTQTILTYPSRAVWLITYRLTVDGAPTK